MYMCVYIYIYIYTHTYIYVHIMHENLGLLMTLARHPVRGGSARKYLGRDPSKIAKPLTSATREGP